MQLDKLQLSVHPRTSWQSFDVGCELALAHYFKLFFLYAIISLPVLVIGLLIDENYGVLLFWLFKPLYERGLLFVLSREVFSARVTTLQALKAFPSLLRKMWFSTITWRRLSVSRSFNLPVVLLEGLTGEKRKNRLRVLHNSTDNNTGWWTTICFLWEFMLLFALIVLIEIFLPSETMQTNIGDPWFASEGLQVGLALNFIYFLSVCIVAPFYVAGGFSAYLNRRVVLEAWDIEISFKKWREQFTANQEQYAKTGANSVINVIAIIMLSCVSLQSPPTFAQEQDVPQPKISANEDAKSTEQEEKEEYQYTEEQLAQRADVEGSVKNALSEKPFSGKRIVTRYEFKYGRDRESEPTNTAFIEFLYSIIDFVAGTIEIIFWVAVAFVFGYLLFRYRKKIVELLSPNQVQQQAELPEFVDSAIIQDSLDNVESNIIKAIENNDYRLALSLLLGASLTTLSSDYGVRIRKSMTENECLASIQQSAPKNFYEFMQSLMRQWVNLAWAHVLPNRETLSTLAESYTFLFGSNRDTSAEPDKPDTGAANG